MINRKNRELKLIFILLAVLFAAFLAFPVLRLLAKSFTSDNGLTISFYWEVFGTRGFPQTLVKSFLIAGVSALVTTILAFLIAYTVHYTNVPG